MADHGPCYSWYVWSLSSVLLPSLPRTNLWRTPGSKVWYKPCMWNICFWPKGYRNISMTINMQLYCKKNNLYQYNIKYQSRSSRKPSITSLNIFEHHLMSVLSGITFHAEDEQLSWRPVCPSKGQCAPRTLYFCSVWSAWWMKKSHVVNGGGDMWGLKPTFIIIQKPFELASA